MDKKLYWLPAAVLAASSVSALASVPQAASSEPAAAPLVSNATGLTAADLMVGRDGKVAIEIESHGVKVADANVTNSGSC